MIAWPAGLASVGVIAGHWATYWLTAPAVHQHERLLADTGHRYWTLVVAAAIGAMVAGFARSTTAILHVRRRSIERGRSYWSLAWRMALMQLAAFLVLETVERAWISSDANPSQLAQEPAVLLGLGLQIITGLVGALLLVVWTRVVRLLSERCGPHSGYGSAQEFPTVTTVMSLRPLPSGISVRDPPF
jgi:hypothetical protein